MSGALVTGAGSRLGRAMALYLAGRGYDVAVHYSTSKDGAQDTVRACKALGVKAVAIEADLLHEAAVADLIPRANAAIGGLNVLVNNASIFEYDNVETATPDSWDRHIGSNLRAPFFLTQAFADQADPVGTDSAGEPVAQSLIVNMIDQRVKKLTPEFMTYTIAKMGLWAMTQTTARGLAPAVRVNAIAPGPTLQGARQTSDHFANQRAGTVLQRGSNVEDITAALGYFLDAKGVTGQMIAPDGGQHLGWKTKDIQGPE
jgi:NAD(P)-dependent dehydrogenase (short-subunit alcohol dehydrogenase family)